MHDFVFIFSVQFCKKYSYTKNGPCQNGGTLKDTGDLAIDAKCECKDGYSGEFCDTVDKVYILNTPMHDNQFLRL